MPPTQGYVSAVHPAVPSPGHADVMFDLQEFVFDGMVKQEMEAPPPPSLSLFEDQMKREMDLMEMIAETLTFW